jgi:pyocin large subunit-like protein
MCTVIENLHFSQYSIMVISVISVKNQHMVVYEKKRTQEMILNKNLYLKIKYQHNLLCSKLEKNYFIHSNFSTESIMSRNPVHRTCNNSFTMNYHKYISRKCMGKENVSKIFHHVYYSLL